MVRPGGLAQGCPPGYPCQGATASHHGAQLPWERTSTTVDGSGPSLSATPYQGHPIVTRTNLARPVSRSIRRLGCTERCTSIDKRINHTRFSLRLLGLQDNSRLGKVKMSDETPIETPGEPLEEPLDETAIGPHTERVTLGQSRRDVLCGAKTSAGTPCRRRPMKGGTKCVLHGGGSPLARQAAERRLLYGVSLALDRLIDAVSEHEHEGPCELCGCSPLARDPVVIRAALGVLDRSGYGPNLTLHTTEEEVRVGEVRVTIVEPDPEQLAEYEASDREALAERNAKFNQELEEQAELEATTSGKHADADGKNTVSIDWETY